jgi:hypothetical protein
VVSLHIHVLDQNITEKLPEVRRIIDFNILSDQLVFNKGLFK